MGVQVVKYLLFLLGGFLIGGVVVTAWLILTLWRWQSGNH
jgi:hypothetical protein